MAFFETPNLITEAANHAGSQSIVITIDVKTELLGKRNCYYGDGKIKSGKDPVEMVQIAESLRQVKYC